MTDEDRADELYGQFLATDEMQDWDEFVEQARKALEANPDAETVTVPAAFLRRVITEIGTTPHMFRVYVERFNQLCDEMGVPEQKIAEGDPRPEDMVAQRKFSVWKKPIHYKDRAKKASDEDDDKGGPF
jgi:hypothetical protein